MTDERRKHIEQIELAYHTGKESGRREVIDQFRLLLDLDKLIADAIKQHEAARHE